MTTEELEQKANEEAKKHFGCYQCELRGTMIGFELDPWEANCMTDFSKFMREKFSPEAFRLRYANQNVPKTDEKVFGSILTDAQRAMTNHLPVAVIDLRDGEYCHADYIKSIEGEVGQWGSRVMCKMESGISANILDVRIITNDEYKQIKQR